MSVSGTAATTVPDSRSALGKLSCERCSRLNKECHVRESKERKRKQIKLTRSEQLEKLESKIENLVHAFSNQQAAKDELSPPDSQVATERSTERAAFHFVNSGPRAVAGGERAPDRGLQLLETICRLEEEADQLKRTTAVEQHAGHSSDDTIRAVEERMLNIIGEVHLDRYRRLMAHGCPFVKIPDDTTFDTAFRQRPILLAAIAVVSSFHDLPKQQSMAKDFMRLVTEKIFFHNDGSVEGSVFFRNEKSIDVLQALLIFITWNHPHLYWSQQVSTLLHLAIAQALDLSIDRWPHAMDRSKFEHAAQRALGTQSAQKSTLEERRAVLGIFYLTSILSSTFRKIDAVKWTTWHEECLKVLEVAQEYQSDNLLVAMIKLQVLVNDLSSTDSSNVPVHAYTKLYHRDMERLRTSNPESETNLHLHSQFVAAEIYIWELSYADLFETKKSFRVMQRHHAEGIYKCIQAVKSNMEFFASIPPESYLTLPFQTFVTFAQAFMSMLRLATLEAEGWDVRDFQEHIDIRDLIERGARCYELASEAVIDGVRVNNDCFTRWAAKLRWSGQVYESKFSHNEVTNCGKPTTPAQPAATNALEITTQTHTLPTPSEELSNPNSLHYLDDPFWSNYTFDFDFSSNDFNML
ncbi:hypothetical protein AMS68_007286 [Peltaster fructicola]|uniref:Transcription factor domain-containing protein n=1 Tax=Peltaster fructicola TaxID=286661 RepID=A0A6H0Y4J4_9PEZI|nr:hypothetical protein AMS68_007286 [Peltaster fructicola]